MNTCRFCGATDARPWMRMPDRFVRCAGCDVVFEANPQTEQQLASIDYHTAFTSGADWDAETPAPVLAAYAGFVQRACRPAGRVLDFGTGTGAFVDALRRSGIDAYGMEPSAVARQHAKARFDLSLSESLREFPTGHFCGVTAIEVAEHIPSPEWLYAVRPLIAAGGFILLTTPNRDSLVAHAKGANWTQATNPFHLVLFNARALAQTLRRAGFVQPVLLRYGPVFAGTNVRRAVHRLLLATGLHSSLRMIARVR